MNVIHPRPVAVRPLLRLRRFFVVFVATLLGFFAFGRTDLGAATFVVSSSSDLVTDPSLRRAILDANANPGPDIIIFNLTVGSTTIVPTAPLPDITEGVVIDAFNGEPCSTTGLPAVEIDGQLAGTSANGLTIGTPQPVTVRGLAIYRFAGAGISVNGSTGGRIEGNHLGTDASGLTSGLGNRTGIQLNGAKGYFVGGTGPCQANVISGNQREGIGLNGALFVPQNNVVAGNFIGVRRDGWALPNGSHGVYFYGGPTANRIDSNVIARNAGAGVLVLEGVDNRMTQNSIYENLGLGIDLTPAGNVNPNDLGDPDAGPNRGQNYPILGAAGGAGGVTSGPSGTHVEGFLNSEPGLPFTIEIFWNPTCDASGFGEGRHYVGTTSVTTDAGGNANFVVNFAEAVPVGAVLTATATHPNGSTSEFSPCATVSAEGAGIVQHSGLPHQGGSTPIPDPCPAGFLTSDPCNLIIPPGPGGQSASVRMALGRVSGWQGDLQDVLLRGPGDHLVLGFLSESNDPAMNPPEEVVVAAKDYVIEVTPRQPAVVVSALTNGSLWLHFTLLNSQDQEIYTGSPMSNSFHLYLNSIDDVVDLSQASYLLQPDGERALKLTFREPLPLTVPGGSDSFSTHAIIAVLRKVASPAGPPTGSLPPSTITSARLDYRPAQSAAGVPLSFRLGEELVQQFGLLHGSINNSVIAGWQWSRGGTGDPAHATFPGTTLYGGFPRDPASGSWTDGGVMLRLDQARYICVDFDWDSAAGATPGAAGVIPPINAFPFFKLIIGTNHVLPPVTEGVWVRKTERDWTVSPSFGVSDTSSNRYEFYRSGVFQGALETSTSTVVHAGSAPLRAAYSTSVSPAGALGFLIRWREAANLIPIGQPGTPGLPGAGGAGFLADELRIIPLHPKVALRAFTRFDLAGAGLPWIEISGEDWRSSRVGRVLVQKVRDGVEFSVPTEVRRPYRIEFTPAIGDPAWQIYDSFLGDGSVRTWRSPGPSTVPGFFRVGGF